MLNFSIFDRTPPTVKELDCLYQLLHTIREQKETIQRTTTRKEKINFIELLASTLPLTLTKLQIGTILDLQEIIWQVQDQEATLNGIEDRAQQVALLLPLLTPVDKPLSAYQKKQLEAKINQALEYGEVTAKKVIDQQPWKYTPAAKTSFKMGLAFIAMLINPGLLATSVTNSLQKSALSRIPHCPEWVKKYSSLILQIGISQLVDPEYTPYKLMNKHFPVLASQYGIAAYLAAPLAVLAYTQGPALVKTAANHPVTTAANEFLGLMYGYADEEEITENSDHWLTQDISTVASNSAQWLWQKAKKTLSFGNPQIALIDLQQRNSSCRTTAK